MCSIDSLTDVAIATSGQLRMRQADLTGRRMIEQRYWNTADDLLGTWSIISLFLVTLTFYSFRPYTMQLHTASVADQLHQLHSNNTNDIFIIGRLEHKKQRFVTQIISSLHYNKPRARDRMIEFRWHSPRRMALSFQKNSFTIQKTHK